MKTRRQFSGRLPAIILLAVGLLWAAGMAWRQLNALQRENHSFIQNLPAAHRAEARVFLARTDAGIAQLRRFLFAAPFFLLASGAALALLAFRRKAPPPASPPFPENRAILERQEKLASLGVFAAGIAHEIRNPLTAIKVRLFSLKQGRGPDSPEREDIEVIGAEIDRLELIVKEFLHFARPADPELALLPLGPLLRDIQEFLQVEFSRKGIRLIARIEADEPVRVDPNKLKQVLLNLAQNGAEAIAGPGTVTLRSRFGRGMLRGRLQPAVIIDVSDTGSGMPPEIQKRLFDPFFTTKEQGTGLGLPIATRIIEKHGGALDYESTPGQGTTFSILLPRISIDERKLENTPG